MLPEEIVNILEKYELDNPKAIDDINVSIENIKKSLQEINKYIAEKTHHLMLEENSDSNNEIELTNESIILRKYIKSISFISTQKETHFHNVEETSKKYTVPIFDNKEKIFLISDNLCPFCDIKLIPHIVHYQRIVKNIVKNENVTWYRCQNCSKRYAIDYDVEDFNFDNTNIKLNRSQYKNVSRLDICSVVVLKNTLRCSSNHIAEDIIAKIPVLNKDGDVSYERVIASYCKTCKRYTVLKNDFDNIDDIFLCQVIDETQNGIVNDNTENSFDIEQNKSILAQYGYNVQTKKDISKKQRQIILVSIIEAKILSKRSVIDHLTTLIERGSKIENWKLATSKWIEDREYISSYNIGELPEIIFDKIILKYTR